MKDFQIKTIMSWSLMFVIRHKDLSALWRLIFVAGEPDRASTVLSFVVRRLYQNRRFPRRWCVSSSVSSLSGHCCRPQRRHWAGSVLAQLAWHLDFSQSPFHELPASWTFEQTIITVVDSSWPVWAADSSCHGNMRLPCKLAAGHSGDGAWRPH